MYKLGLLLSVGAGCFAAAEYAVSVNLWDSGSTPAEQSARSPRYVIGVASIGGRSQRFTFDAGNPTEPMLLAEGCVGCSTGCPSTVPQCSESADACWKSHPDEYAPRASYTVRSQPCLSPAGFLNGDPVCGACFGGASHSRFYTFAEADVTIAGVTIRNLTFGALVRTAPATDRVWSNVGIGYKSHFLSQLGAGSVLLHLRVGEPSFVIFNPFSHRYVGAQSAKFKVTSGCIGQRQHFMDRMVIGNTTVDFDGAPFAIDTGDADIKLNDYSLLSQINSAASTFTPSSAPDLVIVLDGMSVTVPGNIWVTPHGSVFVHSHNGMNMLGLPFITSADIMFDDDTQTLYVVSGIPTGNSSMLI